MKLYGLFGLDSTTHTIIGIAAYNETGTTIVQAYVVDCPTVELQDRAGFAGLAADNGGNLPVTRYWLDTGEVGIGDFIDKHFKRFQIVAQDRHIAFPLEVTATPSAAARVTGKNQTDLPTPRPAGSTCSPRHLLPHLDLSG